MNELRIEDDPKAAMAKILQSLEAHRPRKAEAGVTERIKQHWKLPEPTATGRGQTNVLSLWPEVLVTAGVSLDDFLGFCLRELQPFMEMFAEVHAFLHDYASTPGGRTDHFILESASLQQHWEFDVTLLPRQVEWIKEWHESQRVRLVKADLDQLQQLILIDNGIYYGRTGSWRLLQSLLIARREGYLPPEGWELGNDVRLALLPVLESKLDQFQSTNVGKDPGSRLLVTGYLPHLRTRMEKEWHAPSAPERDRLVGIDLLVATGPVGYSINAVFAPPDSGELAAETNGSDNLSVPGFFCALWGLNEQDFRQVMGDHTCSESRSDVVPRENIRQVCGESGPELLQGIRACIQVDETPRSSRELRAKRVDLLLLPYWKDRWFLYELWLLILPLRRTLQAGGKVELLGVSKLKGARGTNWNLPTQKAQQPVAKLFSPTGKILVWFQRETTRLDSARKMEPDVRLMHGQDEARDLLILEAKDRVKYRASAQKIARGYLTGSQAGMVWVTNYELDPGAGGAAVTPLESRSFGVLTGFRPGTGAAELFESLDAVLLAELEIPLRQISNVLVVDLSGSMTDRFRPIIAIPSGLAGFDSKDIYVWTESVVPASAKIIHLLKSTDFMPCEGTEDPEALAEFIATLPPDAKVSLITDERGLAALKSASLLQTISQKTRIADRSVSIHLTNPPIKRS